jgi:hypothetical protein
VIQIHVGNCVCCGSKVCRRCAGCHSVACDDRVVVCRALVDRRALRRHRRNLKKGAQRRLRKAAI